jgi:hypothetical protein
MEKNKGRSARPVEVRDMCDQKKIEITAFELAQRYVGIKEIPGQVSNPVILAML